MKTRLLIEEACTAPGCRRTEEQFSAVLHTDMIDLGVYRTAFRLTLQNDGWAFDGPPLCPEHNPWRDK